MEVEVTARNNPTYNVSLDSLHMPQEFFTHEDQGSVQVLVVLLDEVLVVSVHLPLVLIIKLPSRVG